LGNTLALSGSRSLKPPITSNPGGLGILKGPSSLEEEVQEEEEEVQEEEEEVACLHASYTPLHASHMPLTLSLD
jgi:hypothetical protein